MLDQEALSKVTEARQHSRELHAESRRVLISAVRRAAAAGHSQRQIAQAADLSQPEVSRLLRFQPSSPRGRKVSRLRNDIIRRAAAAGVTNVRIFGSVAAGDDGADSDVDLLVTLPTGASLFELARLEAELAEVLGERVDLVPDRSLQPHLATRVLAESVPI